jgi:transcriptional regulator with XRE-family HTH domain
VSGKSLRNLCGPLLRHHRLQTPGDRGRPLSLEELAARLEADGVTLSFGQLGKIERQEKTLNDFQLYAIARALAVNVADFFPQELR